MFDTLAMSLTYIRNYSEPIIDPCGTPQEMLWKFDFTPSNKTYCRLLDKLLSSQTSAITSVQVC